MSDREGMIDGMREGIREFEFELILFPLNKSQIKLKRNTIVGQLIRRIKREDYSKSPNLKLTTEFTAVSLYGTAF